MNTATEKIKKYKPYPEYKDSGVEWLGNVPEHWEVKRLKFLTKCLDGKRVPLNSEERGQMQGEYPYWGANGILDYVNDWLFDETLVLLGEDGAPFFQEFKDVAFCVNGKIWVNNHAHILRSQNGCNPKFLTHVLNMVEYRSFIDGTTRDKLTQGDMDNIPVQFPPKAEQQAITDFLDRRTGAIDELVAKKERVIELLREKRTALISHAVTKGLNPDTKMRDSGIDWLGDVPEHWEVKRLKRVSKRIQTGCTPPTAQEYYYEDGTISWYGPGNFGDDLILGEASKLINESAIKDGVARLFEAGSTMIVAIGATIGKVGYIDKPATSNQQITAVAPNIAKVSGKFLAYQLKRLEQVLKGIAPNTTLPIMDQQKIGCLVIAIPPISEQQAITDFLDRETSKIDGLIAKVTEAIEKLKEYRTALISAAVTGKIDLRQEVLT